MRLVIIISSTTPVKIKIHNVKEMLTYTRLLPRLSKQTFIVLSSFIAGKECNVRGEP